MLILLISFITVLLATNFEISSCSENLSIMKCLCNDNGHCVMNELPHTMKSDLNTSSNHSSKIGQCEIKPGGQCFMARVIIFDHMTNEAENNSTHSIQSRKNPKNSSIHIHNYQKFIHTRLGCLSSVERAILSCDNPLSGQPSWKAMSCCNTGDFCNANLHPLFANFKNDAEAVDSALDAFIMHNDEGEFPTHFRHDIETATNIGLELFTINNPQDVDGNRHVLSTPPKNHADSKKNIDSLPVVIIISFTVVGIILILIISYLCVLYKHIVRQRKRPNDLEFPLPRSTRNHGRSRGQLFSRVNTAISLKMRLLPPNLLQGSSVSNTSGQSGSTNRTYSTHLTRNGESYSNDEKIQLSNGSAKLSSAPSIFQPNVCLQVVLKSFLSRGRFSDTWIASWRDELVNVKIFNSSQQNRLTRSICWRLLRLNDSMILRHTHVQGLMAVDWTSYPLSKSISEITNPSNLHIMLISELYHFGTLKELISKSYWSSVRHTRNNIHDQRHTTQDLSEQKCYLFNSSTFVKTNNHDQEKLPCIPAKELLKHSIRMALGIVQGVCFLHSEFAGTRGKSALAHRNLKSANIYVKADWTCCIGDLGFCIRPAPYPLPHPVGQLQQALERHTADLSSSFPSIITVDHPSLSSILTTNQQTSLTASISSYQRARGGVSCGDTGSEGISNNNSTRGSMTSSTMLLSKSSDQSRTGVSDQLARPELWDWWPLGGVQCSTPRYMAPELLTKTIDPFSFESHQKTDIYALSLIIWELISWSLRVFDRPDAHQTQSTGPNSSASTPTTFDSFGSCSTPEPQLQRRDSLTVANSSEELIKWPLAFDFELTTLNRHHVSPSNESLIQHVESSHTPAGDPDIEVMRHLVCDLQTRPRVFTDTRGTFLETQSHLVRDPITYHGSNDCQSSMPLLGSLKYLVGNQHDRPSSEPNTRNAIYDKSKTEKAGPDTSSGASSMGVNSSAVSSLTSDHRRSPDSEQWFESPQPNPNQTCLSQLNNLLSECWSKDPNARLSALRIRKRLQRIIDDSWSTNEDPECKHQSENRSRTVNHHSWVTRDAVIQLHQLNSGDANIDRVSSNNNNDSSTATLEPQFL